jgi:TRAP-type mannitol/chloroaromatic compound transport system permease small subunit
LELWQHLQLALPQPVAWAVFLVVVLIVGCLIVLPALMLLRHEPAELLVWARTRRDELRQLRRHGASQTELALRGSISALECINFSVGRCFAWLALTMALVQFLVVVMRYVFAVGSIQLQESIWYMHALLFMLGAGYGLLKGAHVRVDIFYARATRRRQALIDLLGSAIFVLPLCVSTGWLSWSYVLNAWAVKEGSTEASGLPYIYLLKTVILVFVLLLAIQALASILRSILILANHEAETRRSTGGE